MTITRLGNTGIGWELPMDSMENDGSPEPVPIPLAKAKALTKKHRSLFRILKHSVSTKDVEEINFIMESTTAILYAAVCDAIKAATEEGADAKTD